jgi:hypothetical protein
MNERSEEDTMLPEKPLGIVRDGVGTRDPGQGVKVMLADGEWEGNTA